MVKVKFFSLISLISFLLSGVILADSGFLADNISVNADVSYLSKYGSRITIGDENGVLEKTFGISLFDFSASVWSNQGLKKDDNGDLSNEVNYTLEYGRTFFEKLNLALGYTRYDFPDNDADSDEIYIVASYDFLITPQFLLANDTTNGGRYFEFDLSYTQPIIENLSLGLGATYGIYNKYGADEDEGSGFDFRLEIACNLSENLILTPNIHLLTGTTKNLEEYDDEVYGGVSLSYSL
ncbi:MAG: hypothetical protein LBF97_03555 [Elusimicrobiota bacterium]|jgi:hypothetical protein|nr:hypothetical protein [Elusimicrobiota bacterium]